MKCSHCSDEYEVTLLKKYVRKNGYEGTVVYLDEAGRRVYNNICHACRENARRKRRGSASRDDCEHHKTARAVDGEILAEKKFIELGFEVERTTSHGPDLVCEIGSWRILVEVKTVSTHVDKCGRKWYYVGAVHKKRKSDDLVALVMPNGRVYIDSMKQHLAACNKGGARTVTQLVKEIGLSFDKTSL